MTTEERAEYLAEAAAGYPELCPPSAAEMMEALRLELGDERMLDEFRPYAGGLTRALAPATILHIVSGNTPHAALQTMLRGLLLGSHNLVKFPARGLGDLERFSERLPRELADKLECAREIQPGWKERADAWVVFGDDDTLETLRRECSAGRIFDGHGQRVSYAVVFEDATFESCTGVARDVSLFEQQGCMSPHVVYVGGNARAYAQCLAREMEAFHTAHPAPKLPLATRAALAQKRDAFEFEALSNSGVQLWKGSGWTVVFEENPVFRLSPLDRFVFVKPLPEDLGAAVFGIRAITGGIGIFPATPDHAARLSQLGASRICEIGRMQQTPFSWHSESRRNLADLVQWVDYEGGVC